MWSPPLLHNVFRVGSPTFSNDSAGHAVVASPRREDTPLGEESWSRYCFCLHLLVAESKMTVYFYLESALKSTQNSIEDQTACRHQATHNLIENLLDYYQKNWPNYQIPGSWEILTFGLALIWNENSYFEITHKREVYREKIGIGNNDAWYFQNKIRSPGRASFQSHCCILRSCTSSQSWGWQLTLWDCWLQLGLPALLASQFGGSEPMIPVSQEAHQASW